MPTPIHSITPFTLLDFPGKTACILWFAGCNMRCPYCYNPEIVLGKGQMEMDVALRFLRSRKGLLEGVVLSGGECTLHAGIFQLLTAVKQEGFDVKIDTNGSRPNVLRALLEQRLIDYIALDFKATESNYHRMTRSGLFPGFAESLALLNEAGIPFEVRTTVHSALIGENDLRSMVGYLHRSGYRGTYYIQHFVNDVPTLADLPWSVNNIPVDTLSTCRIQVLARA